MIDAHSLKPGEIYAFDMEPLWEEYNTATSNNNDDDWHEISISGHLSLIKTYTENTSKSFFDLFDNEAAMSIASCGYDQYNSPYGDKARFVEYTTTEYGGKVARFDILDEEGNPYSGDGIQVDLILDEVPLLLTWVI